VARVRDLVLCACLRIHPHDRPSRSADRRDPARLHPVRHDEVSFALDRDAEREVEQAVLRHGRLGAAARIDPDDATAAVRVEVVGHPEHAAGSNGHPCRVDQLIPARDEALVAGQRVYPDQAPVSGAGGLFVLEGAGRAEVRDDQGAARLDRQVVGALEQRPLRAVAGDLDQRAGGGIGAQHHGAAGEAVGRVHDIGVPRRGRGRRPRNEQHREQRHDEVASPANCHRR
jgi:hypothetical protein